MSMVESALSYAGRGWAVLPLHTPVGAGCSCGEDCGKYRGKHPRTKHGLRDATTDLDQIREWWDRWPEANIGVVGGPGRYWALDLDLDESKPGWKHWEQLCAEHGLPRTRTVRTGSGGLHLLWRWTPELTAWLAREKRQLVNVNGWPVRGIDIRQGDGYIVAPPSLHLSGQRYQVIDTAELVDAPTWVLEMASKPEHVAAPSRPYVPPQLVETSDRERRFCQQALLGACQDVAAAQSGSNRHRLLYTKAHKLAGYVAAGLLEEELVTVELQRAGEACGLDTREAAKAIRDALAVGLAKPIRPQVREDAFPVKMDREQAIAWWSEHAEMSSGEVAQVLGIAASTLRRWQAEARPIGLQPAPREQAAHPAHEQAREQAPVHREQAPVHREQAPVHGPDRSPNYEQAPPDRSHDYGQTPPVHVDVHRNEQVPAHFGEHRNSTDNRNAGVLERLNSVRARMASAPDRIAQSELLYELVGDATFIADLASARERAPTVGVAELMRLGDAYPGGKTVVKQIEEAVKATLKATKKAAKTVAPTVEEAPAVEASGERPEIRITTNVSATINQALAALNAADLPLYQRGGQLVHLTRDAAPQGMNWEPETPSLRPVKFGRMFEMLSYSARWVKGRQTPQGYQEEPALPPKFAVEGVFAREQWPFRRAIGMAEIPILRPNGTIHDAPGYDVETGFLYEPPRRFSVPWPKQELTQELAAAALDALYEPLQDFPFADPWHRTAAVACLLTLVGRPAIDGPVPLFAFTATTPKSGKSLLADLLYWITTGRDTPRMAPGKDDEEMQKQITGAARLGVQAVLFDNIEEPLGGPSLDAALTARVWQGRVLGGNDFYIGPLRTVFMATANGIAIKGDMAQRVIPIHLEPEEEQPELRTGFAIPRLRSWVLTNRARLVSAALTMLRCHAAAGRPSATHLGAYEEWNDVVRNCIIWAGGEDPYKGVAQMVEGADERKGQMRDLLESWREAFVGQAVWLSELPERLDRHPGLAQVLKLLAANRDGSINWRSVAYLFRRARGRVYGGLRLERSEEKRHGSNGWRVIVVKRTRSDEAQEEQNEIPA